MDHVNKQLRIQFFIELLSVRGEGQVTVTNRSPHCIALTPFFSMTSSQQFLCLLQLSLSQLAGAAQQNKGCSAEYWRV